MFGAFKKTLQKTVDSLKAILPRQKKEIDKDLLEEILLSADVSYELTQSLLQEMPEVVTRSRLEVALLNLFRGESYYDRLALKKVDAKPCVEIVVGVNGAGKTTTIAKLARRYKNEGKSVILGAGDTFRAAAIEQLRLWAERLEVPIVSTQQGHDPSGVAYDTIASALSRGLDQVILDTAGRLHNKTNLQNELKKVVRVCDKACPGAPHRKILVLDGTQGNSAIEQARVFHEVLEVDGIIITKLDGTSKGGALFSIVEALRIPIIYIGTGESAEDLLPFEEQEFVKTLLDGIFSSEQD